MHNLFILGIKHSGKTTFARLLAESIHVKSIDSDDLILEKIKPLSVRDFYREHGGDAFKEIEVEAISDFLSSNKDNFIMSLGGGAGENEKLVSLIKQNGLIIYLKRPKDEMLPVILKHGTPAFLDPNDLEGSFNRMYERRNALYESIADKAVDMGSYRDRGETLLSLIDQLGDVLK